jgi:hypothetical protein
VMTNDPENVKCALSGRFEDWYVYTTIVDRIA